MGTPDSITRSMRPNRIPTPRFTERKKRLFDGSDSDDDLLLTPLANLHLRRSKRNLGQQIGVCIEDTDDEDAQENLKSNSTKNNSKGKEKIEGKVLAEKSSNFNTDDEKEDSNLEELFATSMQIDENMPDLLVSALASKSAEKTFNDSQHLNEAQTNQESPTTGNKLLSMGLIPVDENQGFFEARKRRLPATVTGFSPMKKNPKTDAAVASISTRMFYSTKEGSASKTLSETATPKMRQRQFKSKTSPKARRRERVSLGLNFNKGVHHKIRRRSHQPGAAKRLNYDSIDRLLNNVRNEKLRQLIQTKRDGDAQIEKIRNIFQAPNPIDLAHPLQVLKPAEYNNNNNNETQSPLLLDANDDDGFSDIDSDGENSHAEEVALLSLCKKPSLLNEFQAEGMSLITPHDKNSPQQPDKDEGIEEPSTTVAPPSNRKFFKTGRSKTTRKEITITENIKATMQNGKMQLMTQKKKKRSHKPLNSTVEFEEIKTSVETILDRLDTSALDVAELPVEPIQKPVDQQLLDSATAGNTYDEFFRRLPYNTDDPQKIQQQHTLLDFLIKNNICNEWTFNVFIVDPDKHAAEAERIVMEVMKELQPDLSDGVQLTDLDDFEMGADDSEAFIDEEIPYITAEQTQSKTSFPIAQSPAVANTKNLFPIFYLKRPYPQDDTQTTTASTSTTAPSSGLQKAAMGANQLQIDAGQKCFGAVQCKQCGLVYSAHEAEEEQLHREYHNSLHVLNHKGWTDEDIVRLYPEWGQGGRIIRLDDKCVQQRRDRLQNIIKFIDKELGCAVFTLPPRFVAFLAVLRSQIVGFCLIVPLEKAHKYLFRDGVDCCSEEEYSVSCGISRIWVSPLQRRKGIGHELIKAVQSHTIFGLKLPVDHIAFSAPTEQGKCFAQKVTKTLNFLVYQA